MFGFLINLLSFIAQAAISFYAINNTVFYNDPTYGVCSFCFKISQCKTSYSSYITGLD